VRTRPETKRIGGRRMRQKDIGNLKESMKTKLSEKGSFNDTGNLVIAALN
jgi:hypothetical protein